METISPSIKISDLDGYDLDYKLKINALWEFFKHTEKFFIQNLENKKLTLFEETLLTNSDSNFGSKMDEQNKLIGTILSNPIYLIVVIGTVIFSLKKV